MIRHNFFVDLLALLLLISAGCSLLETKSEPPQAADAPSPIHSHPLPVAAYPPSSTPYYVESYDFWLVRTLENELYSFVPVSPDYADHISVEECRFVWSEPVQRFVDPCSGDEWELDGRLNRENSTELWSSRDLDRLAVTIEDGFIYVHLDQVVPGKSRNETTVPPREPAPTYFPTFETSE